MTTSQQSSSPSLCIPRVFPNITEKQIYNIFIDLNIGEIKKIDIVLKTGKKGEKINRVFIHFKSWFTNEVATNALKRLQEGKDIKIIYDDPWYWKVSIYTPRETPKISQKSESNTTTNLMPLSSIKYDNDRKANQVENSILYLDREPFWKRRYYADEDWETMIKNNK